MIKGKHRPVDQLDAACEIHDSDLAKGASYRRANQKFIENLQKIPGWKARAAEIGFRALHYGENRMRGYGVDTRGGLTEIAHTKSRVKPKFEPYSELLGEASPAVEKVSLRRPVEVPVVAEKVLTAVDKPTVINQPTLAHNTRINMQNAKNKKQSKPKPGKLRGTRTAAAQQTRFAPSSKATVIENQGPSTSYSASGDVRVRHRENIGELTLSSSAFTILPAYVVNPGMSGTFPWLSTIASRFDKYRIHRLSLYFESEAATTSAGSVLMFFDYNAVDSPPTNKVAMMGSKGAVKTVPWLDAHCIFDPKQMDHDLFIRQGTVSTTDLKTYDAANFWVATTNTASSGTIGDLWIEYDITLKNPSETAGVGAAFVSGGTVNNGALWGTYGSQTLPKGVLPGTWSANTFTFNQTGTFTFICSGSGTLSAIATNSGTVSVGDVFLTTSGTAFILVIHVKAVNGQTLITSGPVGTVTGSTWYIASTVPEATVA